MVGHERTPDSDPTMPCAPGGITIDNPTQVLRHAAWLAWSLWGLTLACASITILLLVRGPQTPSLPGEDRGATIFLELVVLAFATVGALVGARRPGNAIGWIFCGVGLTYGVVVCARTYALVALFAAPGRLPGGAVAAWLAAWLTLPPVFLIGTFLPLLFPTGRPPTPRWRSLAWLGAGGIAVLTLAVALAPGPLPNPGFATIANPFGLGGAAGTVARRLNAGLPLLPLCAVAATLSLVPRTRRARGAERQQLKWFLGAAALVAGGLGAALALEALGRSAEIALDFTRLVGLGLPLAAGVGILRHRLWDIDVLINRALVYGTLTASVVGLYVLVVGGAGTLLQARDSSALSLAATGLVAVLFQPLRARLQRGANRLLWGERDSPYEAIARLGRDLERAPAPEAVLPTIVANVARTLKLPHAAIWLVDGETLRPAAVHGPALLNGAVRDPSALATLRAASTGLPPESFSVTGTFRAAFDRSGTGLVLPLAHRGELVGALCLASRGPGEGFSTADRRLLRDLASQVGAAARAVQLTAALRTSLDALQRSRERLVTAQEEERRRIQRDLHDGLGPTLASMRLRLEACLVEAEAGAPALAADLERLDELVGQATSDIRRLVEDLRPPVLDQLGLLPALQQWVERFGRETGIATELMLGGDVAVPAAAEVAVFRVAQEALVNVQKHARLARVARTVRTRRLAHIGHSR